MRPRPLSRCIFLAMLLVPPPHDAGALVAAHPVYPFGTVVRVTNIRNGKSVDVRIVDRGPARGPRRAGVIIDLSRSAAEVLDFVRDGRTEVHVARMRVPGTGRSAPGAD
jgi:rare lipoprotein A